MLTPSGSIPVCFLIDSPVRRMTSLSSLNFRGVPLKFAVSTSHAKSADESV